MQIRVLEITDLEKLKNLYELCFNNECNIDIMKNEYEKIKNCSNTKQLVLVFNDQIIGHIKYDIILDMFGSGRSYMYISDLCIHPNYRGKGYSKLLMNYCERDAVNSDCKYIFLNSSEFRKTAHKLYDSLGYIIRDSRIYRKVF